MMSSLFAHFCKKKKTVLSEFSSLAFVDVECIDPEIVPTHPRRARKQKHLIREEEKLGAVLTSHRRHSARGWKNPLPR